MDLILYALCLINLDSFSNYTYLYIKEKTDGNMTVNKFTENDISNDFSSQKIYTDSYSLHRCFSDMVIHHRIGTIIGIGRSTR